MSRVVLRPDGHPGRCDSSLLRCRDRYSPLPPPYTTRCNDCDGSKNYCSEHSSSLDHPDFFFGHRALFSVGSPSCIVGREAACPSQRLLTRQTDAARVRFTFFARIQPPNCSPSTIPRRPSKATMGGAGLFTRITPYKTPTNNPTANETRSTFMVTPSRMRNNRNQGSTTQTSRKLA